MMFVLIYFYFFFFTFSFTSSFLSFQVLNIIFFILNEEDICTKKSAIEKDVIIKHVACDWHNFCSNKIFYRGYLRMCAETSRDE